VHIEDNKIQGINSRGYRSLAGAFTLTITLKGSLAPVPMPNICPLALRSIQSPVKVPGLAGARRLMDRSTLCPGVMLDVKLYTLCPSIRLPFTKTSAYPVVQVHVPVFFIRQLLEKKSPGRNVLPSGMVVLTRVALSQVIPEVGEAVSPELKKGWGSEI